MRVCGPFVVILWMLVLMNAGAGAQPAPADAPMAPAISPSSSSDLVAAESARRALELGFPSMAASLYQAMLDAPEAPAGDINALILSWTTALLDDGRPEEAGRALARHVGPPSPSYRLRVALVAAATGDRPGAEAVLSELDPTTLPAGEKSWFHYLTGMLASSSGEFVEANEAYERAMTEAPSDLARARFLLSRLTALLKGTGEMTDANLNLLRQNVEQHRGRSTGYQFAELYAAALSARGERETAMRFLQDQLQALPAQERGMSDNFRLTLGLIAGADDGVGRLALNSLLESAVDRDKQRIALQLLARASQEGTLRSGFRDRLSSLIGGARPHPLLEDLLLFRAQLALEDKRYGDAEADAATLLEQFPGSMLKAAALGVLMGSAWERGQFRRAADFATQARAETKSRESRAALAVVVAEAYFRAFDYRSAADSYGLALEDTPAGVAPGGLMFQWVFAEIAGGRFEQAALVLDTLGTDPRFDLVSRWQAEWNLARALQTSDGNGVSLAYGRVNRLLAGAGATWLPPELYVRMAWLQARLAFDDGEAARSLELVTNLHSLLADLDPVLRAEVASSLALLEAQASFALSRPDTGLEVLQRLRLNYPQTDVAVFSYVIEAEAYVAQGRLVDAQRVFVKMADDFPDNRYAPYGLLQAALTVRKLGQDPNRREAYNILERLVQNYPRSDLIFNARFAQGDLLRELNQFANALQIYERLVLDFPQHGDVRAAELAVADCHAALAAADVSRLESAIAGYERLQFLPTASLDLRLEAGFKHGSAFARSGKRARAQQVWWPMVEPLLAEGVPTMRMGVGGRYWLARTLLELGLLHEQESRLEQARDLYLLILRQGLPRADEARSALARLGVVNAAP